MLMSSCELEWRLEEGERGEEGGREGEKRVGGRERRGGWVKARRVEARRVGGGIREGQRDGREEVEEGQEER